jgi:hypothetical protein
MFDAKLAHKLLGRFKMGMPEAVFLVLCDPSMNELWVT